MCLCPSAKFRVKIADDHFFPRSFQFIIYIIMRKKPTSTYEDVLIYYTIDDVIFLHISATYCGHLHSRNLAQIILSVFYILT